MIHFWFPIFFTTLLVTRAFASEERSLELNTYQIPGLVVAQADNTFSGSFYNLGQTIIERLGLKHKIVVLPPQRTVKQFVFGQSLGYFPATAQQLSIATKPYCRTRTFAQKRDFIFFKKSQPATELKHLRGKTIGVTHGYPFDPSILNSKDYLVIKAHSDSANFRMLHSGRIDFFLVEEITGLTALDKLGLRNIGYNPQFPIDVQDGFFVFQKTSKGERLCQKFDKVLGEILAKKEFNYLENLETLREKFRVD